MRAMHACKMHNRKHVVVFESMQMHALCKCMRAKYMQCMRAKCTIESTWQCLIGQCTIESTWRCLIGQCTIASTWRCLYWFLEANHVGQNHGEHCNALFG